MDRRKTRLEHRGRRILSSSLVAFLLLQLIGGALLDYRWPELRFSAAYGRFAALAKHARSPDLIYLGSSRSQLGLNEIVLTDQLRRRTGRPELSVFDGAVPAGDPIVMEFVFAELVKRGATPEWVMIELTHEALNARNDLVSEHVLRQLRWEDMPHFIHDIVWAGKLGRFALGRFLPLYVHRHEMVRQARDRVASWAPAAPSPVALVAMPAPAPLPSLEELMSFQPVAWRCEIAPVSAVVGQPPALEPKVLAATGSGLNAVRRYLRNYRIGGRPRESLERLLDLCQAHRCNILLLGAPVSSAQRQLYTPAIDSEYRRYVHSLEVRYSCRFVDCRDWMPDHLFFDNHHALPEGGLYFSRLLAEKVLQDLWRNPGTIDGNQPNNPTTLKTSSP